MYETKPSVADVLAFQSNAVPRPFEHLDDNFLGSIGTTGSEVTARGGGSDYTPGLGEPAQEKDCDGKIEHLDSGEMSPGTVGGGHHPSEGVARFL